MKILVTGANGFIGKNFVLRLRERPRFKILTFVRGEGDNALKAALAEADFVVHLAGENRPINTESFAENNVDLTKRLCQCLRNLGKAIPVLLASSTHAEQDSSYGQSKLASESAVEALAKTNSNPVVIYRLPGVFGKWCKPNYNSVVATFCYNTINNFPVRIDNPSTILRLVYIDDVVESFLNQLEYRWIGVSRLSVQPEYRVTLGELAKQIKAFKYSRTTLMSERVGTGMLRALYATYVSYYPIEQFAYDVPVYRDKRGVFVEMLKTPDVGQFSFFTVEPGVTRGKHYHHSKSEKFLVIKGCARLSFRHLINNEIHNIDVDGQRPKIVETIPGWVHDITNIGDEELVVLVWASEVFDRSKPDTFLSEV